MDRSEPRDRKVRSQVDARDLSLADLEALLQARRQRDSERRLRRVASAEEELSKRQTSNSVAGSAVDGVRPPDSWRGALGADRRFPSLGFSPLVPLGGEATSQRRRLTWRSWLMLSFEIAALIGFLVVVANSFAALQDLNRQSRELQRAQLPLASTVEAPAIKEIVVVATPTAVIVLPGERPIQGQVQLPERLVGVIRSMAPLAEPPTPVPEAPIRIVIPALEVDAPVIQGDTWDDLKKGVGHRAASANPGQVGNMVLSAHNDIYGEIFRYLDKLAPGDHVLVYTRGVAYQYVINSVSIVEPTSIEVMDPTDYASLTLISCYPYLLDTHRVVAKADLVDSPSNGTKTQ